MKVLIGCEESQAICKAFRNAGHEAYSCDLQDCSGGHPEWHFKQSVFTLMKKSRKWDLIILHPDCTFLTNSGVRWLYENGREKDMVRWNQLKIAMTIFIAMRDSAMAVAPMVALENPIPHCYARDGFEALPGIGRPNQIIQPYQFGHGESKATGLWLYNLPLLQATKLVEGREGKVHRMAPGPDRKKLRSKTYSGIAEAMAEQWGSLLPVARTGT